MKLNNRACISENKIANSRGIVDPAMKAGSVKGVVSAIRSSSTIMSRSTVNQGKSFAMEKAPRPRPMCRFYVRWKSSLRSTQESAPKRAETHTLYKSRARMASAVRACRIRKYPYTIYMRENNFAIIYRQKWDANRSGEEKKIRVRYLNGGNKNSRTHWFTIHLCAGKPSIISPRAKNRKIPARRYWNPSSAVCLRRCAHPPSVVTLWFTSRLHTPYIYSGL